MRTDLLHDSGSFVSAGYRQGFRGDREVALEDVVIGVAEAGGHHLDQQLILAGTLEFEFNHFPFAWGFE
jgi:hypothetical protein